MYKIKVELISVIYPGLKQNDQFQIEWKRGPQNNLSTKVDVEEVDPNGLYMIESNFERISKFRYDQKDNILPKYCDFKFLLTKQNGATLSKP